MELTYGFGRSGDFIDGLGKSRRAKGDGDISVSGLQKIHSTLVSSFKKPPGDNTYTRKSLGEIYFGYFSPRSQIHFATLFTWERCLEQETFQRFT